MSVEDIQIKALNTLIGGVRLAQSKGCYSLEEAGEICSAINVFIGLPAQDQQESPVETQDKKKKK